MLGRKDGKPTAPVNLLADMAGGGLLCAFGICVALLDRYNSGKGQVVDSSMTEGAAYVASWLFKSKKLPYFNESRGYNYLDGNSFFYDTYETKDGKFMSVGALEPQFFTEFIKGLGLQDRNIEQMDSDNDEIKKLIEATFKQNTQKEWCDIFDNTDACVFPVVDWEDVADHSQHTYRKSFIRKDGDIIPVPAPRLSRTPATSSALKQPINNDQTNEEILVEIGYDHVSIAKLKEEGTILVPNRSKL